MRRRTPLSSALKNRGHLPGDDAVIKLLWLWLASATSKTSEPAPAPAPRRNAYLDTMARPPPGSSKEPPCTAGSKPSAPHPDLPRPARRLPQLTQPGDHFQNDLDRLDSEDADHQYLIRRSIDDGELAPPAQPPGR